MKKLLLSIILSVGALQPLMADEGMWLPMLVSQRIEDMQQKGFKLSAEDIYSVNKASLKDAVVLFGGGCTGEIVSDEGLLFTNHHCGYSHIQKLSSVEHDYLKDGFWAMNRSEELPAKGLTVSFLERMDDVTDEVLKGWHPSMGEAARDSIVRNNIKIIERKAVGLAPENKGLTARVEALFYSNKYYLFVFRVYRDIRLVAAPPSSIGKFGGETDNWMWPRHTGDFSIFRIYAGKDNMPADYSEENIPYTPKRSFTISRAGAKEGDFTFIYGCPASTKEYVISDEVKYVAEVSDPAKVEARTARLNIFIKYMNQSQKVRIQYSAKKASVANAWKKWQGESKGLIKLKSVAKKQKYEAEFEKWAKGSEFEGVTEKLHELYKEYNKYHFAYEYSTETVAAIELPKFAYSFAKAVQSKSVASTSFTTSLPSRAEIDAFYKDYYAPIDRDCFKALLELFNANVSDEMKPAAYKEMLQKYGGVEKWCDAIYNNSLFLTQSIVYSLTEKESAKIENDPAFEMYKVINSWRGELRKKENELMKDITLCYRLYMRGQMAFESGKSFYPDANRTLRVAYGKVKGFSPADGIEYLPVSTLKGIMQKDNPNIFDYNIPQSLRDIYAKGGYDNQPVCFIATNHTSGGNSGSPVISADGYLLGINFDRVWEGTMSDYNFDPEICRNICVDVRYILFIIKEIGHAEYLFNEMKFAE